LDRFPAPRRILVQWVPHGYGYRSMNVMFCWWLWNRARRGDRVELMVHEPYLPFRAGSLRQNVAALVHRLMTVLLLRAAAHVWISIPEWERRLRPYALGRPVPLQWLPIPSSIPMICSAAGAQAVRKRYLADGRVLIGHFGTFGWPISPMLEEILLALTGEFDAQVVLLIGLKSEEFRLALIQKEPRLAAVVHATGTLSAEDLSCHLAACDLMIQPYPDGVSTRRTSFMAGLSHGRAIITTTGTSTEPLWRQTDAVALAAVNDVAAFLQLLRRLRSDVEERYRMGESARNIYRERFDVCHTVDELRRAAGAFQHSVCAS
jgi:glycosyltransferase involved in cell wall biosynthesis